jgi:hypothetical protein
VSEYPAWIDGFAKGIGNKDAVVILEPDGLGIIPHYTTVEGTAEWCRPAEADPATAAEDRFAMLDYAVERLGTLPNTAVYLDGTHSGWLSVGDISDRLLKAGVEDADGFFLNASNYQYTANLTAYGTWVSSCIALITQLEGAFSDCGSRGSGSGSRRAARRGMVPGHGAGADRERRARGLTGAREVRTGGGCSARSPASTLVRFPRPPCSNGSGRLTSMTRETPGSVTEGTAYGTRRQDQERRPGPLWKGEGGRRQDVRRRAP